MSELTHFGVPGMKWGHRRANAASRKSAVSDYKSLKKINRRAGVGSRKALAQIKADIEHKMATDPVYAAKFKNIPAERARAIKAATFVGLGAMVVYSYAPLAYSAIHSPKVVNTTNKGADWLAGKIREAKVKAPRNPKNSPYWNDMTIKSSATLANMAMELYRGL